MPLKMTWAFLILAVACSLEFRCGASNYKSSVAHRPQPHPLQQYASSRAGSQSYHASVDHMTLVLLPAGAKLPENAIPVALANAPLPQSVHSPVLGAGVVYDNTGRAYQSNNEATHLRGYEHSPQLLGSTSSAVQSVDAGADMNVEASRSSSPHLIQPSQDRVRAVPQPMPVHVIFQEQAKSDNSSVKTTSTQSQEEKRNLGPMEEWSEVESQVEDRVFVLSMLCCMAVAVGALSVKRSKLARHFFSRCVGRDLYDEVRYDAAQTKAPEHYVYSTFTSEGYPWKGGDLEKFDV